MLQVLLMEQALLFLPHSRAQPEGNPNLLYLATPISSLTTHQPELARSPHPTVERHLAFQVLGMKKEVVVNSTNDCLSVFHRTKIT